jgi:uncharacterized membrane protein YkvA (DUF1232 family)
MGRSLNVRGARRRPKTAARATPTRRATKHNPSRTVRPPLLTRADVTRGVLELANTLAPADVGDLLAEESTIRERAAQLPGAPGRRMRAELDLALLCLTDHLAGECPQIPYYAISLLAAGVAYLADQLDFIPDFLPRIGMLDDALVMEVAIELAGPGLKRYCVWKGIGPAPAKRAAGARAK